MNDKGPMLLISCLIFQLIIEIHCNINDGGLKRLLVRRQTCSDPNACFSQWGWCGFSELHCGPGCKSGPCIDTSKPSKCPDPNACFSQWGWCGFTELHCGPGCQSGPCIGGVVTTPAPTTRSTTQSPPSGCSDPNACLSQWGFCGHSELHCGQGCRSGPCTGGVVTTPASTTRTTPVTTTRTTTQSPPSPCPDPKACLSQSGDCGYTDEFCGEGCQGGPCTGTGGSENVITDSNFACVFSNLDASTRGERLDGLRKSGYKPANADEAAVFLAHVYHETDGLRTLTEYCAPGCGHDYDQSWCGVQAVPGKLYYGRGWFQLSYPCNYHGAGQALGLDLLNNPDLVSQEHDVAVKTAVWFFESNNMFDPARRGDFAATTSLINGPRECNGGPGFTSQQTRVATYLRVRQCFGLGEPTINPTC